MAFPTGILTSLTIERIDGTTPCKIGAAVAAHCYFRTAFSHIPFWLLFKNLIKPKMTA